MAGQVNRDYEKIIGGLKNLHQAIEETKKEVMSLQKSAEGAEAYLKDPVGLKHTQKLKELTAEMLKAVDTGDERVLERLKQAELEKDRYERLMDEGREGRQISWQILILTRKRRQSLLKMSKSQRRAFWRERRA